jgi:hypothetical protein
MRAHACNLSYKGGRGRRITAQEQPQAKSMKPYLKNNQTKNRAGGVAQVVACLPSKCESLSSNPSTSKKKKT